MKEKNLPIKLVMQKAEDTKSNDGGGRVKFFGEVTSGLQTASCCFMRRRAFLPI